MLGRDGRQPHHGCQHPMVGGGSPARGSPAQCATSRAGAVWRARHPLAGRYPRAWPLLSLPACLPACLLPAWERKERQGRALQSSPSPDPHPLPGRVPTGLQLQRHPGAGAAQGTARRAGGATGLCRGSASSMVSLGALGGGGTPVLTPQLVPATPLAHPADAGAAPGTWGVQEVASAHMSVRWHWTLLPACAAGTGDPHSCLAQGVGRGLVWDPSPGR